MRKILVVCLLSVLLCAVVSVAVGEEKSTWFSLQTNAISDMPTWGEAATADDNYWHVNWAVSITTLNEYRRAVVRIMDETGEENMSSLWVYSTFSSAEHPYKVGKITPNVTKTLFGCRLDNRDLDYSPLVAAGWFYH